MKKRSARQYRNPSVPARFGGRTSSLRKSYGIPIIVLTVSKPPSRRVAGGCESTVSALTSTLQKIREIVAAARIKPAVVQVEAYPYLPEWELLDFCREHGIVLLAFAPLGHGVEPKVTEDPAITAIAWRVHKALAQVELALAVQCGAAFLATSTKARRIRESFDIAMLPEDANREIRDGVATQFRFNQVVGTGVLRFIPRTK
jgi:Aldo/keto reductase family